jgi:hypothetical protein
MYFRLGLNDGLFEKNDEFADFKLNNSLLRDSAKFQIIKMDVVYAFSPIQEAVNHLLVVRTLEHQKRVERKIVVE